MVAAGTEAGYTLDDLRICCLLRDITGMTAYPHIVLLMCQVTYVSKPFTYISSFNPFNNLLNRCTPLLQLRKLRHRVDNSLLVSGRAGI